MTDAYFHKNLLTLTGLRKSDFQVLFHLAETLEPIVFGRTRSLLLADKVLGIAFFQSSTRTRISFESAMHRLGGSVVGFADPKTTRAGDYYQESIEDVARMMESYADIIVLRHPEDFAPLKAANVVEIPVINAGDGYNEHPTQGLLDMYTIYRLKGSLDGLKIALVGDMNMRVFHSLPIGLSNFDCELTFVSHNECKLPELWRNKFKEQNVNFSEMSSLESILSKLDVIYLMGTKTPSYNESWVKPGQSKGATPDEYIIDLTKLSKAKDDVILLHPLPRKDELPKEVDLSPYAKYFLQAKYGVVVRMALLSLIAGRY